MTDPYNAQGTPGPSGWQPGYPPASPQSPAPTSGAYPPGPPAGAPQQAWPGWPGQPTSQAHPSAPPPSAGVGGPQGATGTTKQQSAGRTRFALGAGIGFVVALAVVGVLLLTHVLSIGSSDDATTAADTTPITMPDTLAGFRTTVAVSTEKGGADRGKQMAERNSRTIDLTVKSYQQAYDGAAVGVQMYSTDGLDFFGTAIVVRAESPGLTIGPIPDPADLGLAQNMRETVVVGDAECLVNHTRGTVAGKTPDPQDDLTSLCQRTGPGLTVQIFGNASTKSGAQQSDMVKMADELYAQLATS
jgi:hypothetical protein